MRRLVLALAIWLVLPGAARADHVELKVATPFANGTKWAEILEDAAESIDIATMGRVELNFSRSWIGDDRVVKKVRDGWVDGAVLSGAGLALLEPDVNVLRLPRLFEDELEVDYVLRSLLPRVDAQLATKGLALTAWVHGGWLRFYATGPITTIADLLATKMWVDRTDAIMIAYFKSLGVSAIPLDPVDVLLNLKNGTVDAAYGRPLAMLALSWSKKLSNASSAPFAVEVGGIVFREDALAKLSAADRLVVEDELRKAAELIGKRFRKDDTLATRVMKKDGMKSDSADAKFIAELDRGALHVWQGLAGHMYSVAVLEDVLDALAKYRNKPAPMLATTGTILPVTAPAKASAKPKAVPAHVDDDEPQPSYTLTSKLPSAPDHLRALRVALHDCDVAQFDWSIVFPITIDNKHYSTPAELRRDCRAGTLPVPTLVQLNATLDSLKVTDREMTFTIDSRTWHFDWRDFTWMLTAVD